MLACMYTCVVLISSNVQNLLQTLINRARVNVRSCTMENASSLDALMQNFLLFILNKLMLFLHLQPQITEYDKNE